MPPLGRILLPITLNRRCTSAAVGLGNGIEDGGDVGAATPPGCFVCRSYAYALVDIVSVFGGAVKEEDVRQVLQVAFMHILDGLFGCWTGGGGGSGDGGGGGGVRQREVPDSRMIDGKSRNKKVGQSPFRCPKSRPLPGTCLERTAVTISQNHAYTPEYSGLY
ncbi:hypothetical protein BDW59DRAFT_70018 [Aspergillus cavernicola]|uniref:Uncharacterized protein n=1 Tax=Aspergillus cavernicola TaxID=176166 RepID=A0ABR4IDD3_9EURO